MGRIFGVLVLLVALPLCLLLLRVPSFMALPLIAVAAIALLIYGGYWTMRIVHIDRARVRLR